MEFLLASVALSRAAVKVSLRPRVAKYLGAKVAAGLDLAGLIGIFRDALRGVSRGSAAFTSKQIQDIRRKHERAVNRSYGFVTA